MLASCQRQREHSAPRRAVLSDSEIGEPTRAVLSDSEIGEPTRAVLSDSEIGEPQKIKKKLLCDVEKSIRANLRQSRQKNS